MRNRADEGTGPEARSRRRSALRVGITVDPPDWHSAALTAALETLGACAVAFRLVDCGFDTTVASGLDIPGFAGALPDAVLARAISGGTFEAVTMRLGVLHALRESGVPVWNDARTIERCVDKSTTSFFLGKAGIPTPPTWTTESPEKAADIVRHETAAGHRLVFKPLFGAQGRGLRLVDGPGDLPDVTEAHGVYYLQRYVDTEGQGFRDTRILVSGGRVVAAMIRHADHWITNIKQGGRPLPVTLDSQTADLALACAKLVDARFCGVDIVRDRDGRPWVIEVNSMPAWRGLQEVTPFDIAAVLAGDLVEAVRASSAGQDGLRSRAGEGARHGAQSPRVAFDTSQPPSPVLLRMTPSLSESEEGTRATVRVDVGNIAAAFIGACTDELLAPKPGNVHVFAEGHGWRAADFVVSAEASAPAIARVGARIGPRILDAVEATKARVGHNSNLGILLLCAPLAAAAELAGDLRAALAQVLDDLDVSDAAAAFLAIALAAPGGLGRAEEHDVMAPATVGLREAMAAAADRDRVARQYVTAFGDVFEIGVPAYAAALERWCAPTTATLATYLAFLSQFPDTHIARKHGHGAAEAVRRDAAPLAERLGQAEDPSTLTSSLLAFDADLKRRGLNPGTSADLTVATCFTFRLKNVLPPSYNSD